MDLASLERRRARWLELERLLEVAEHEGLKTLSVGDIQRLSSLYRRASADLLWARGTGASGELADALNDLVARAYALTAPRPRFQWRAVFGFIATEFPVLLRREWRLYALAVALFAAGGLFGYAGMAQDPDAAVYLLPAEHLKVDPQERAIREAHHEGASLDAQAQFSTFLFTHNIQVAFFAFALGVTFGVGTVLMLFFNGLMLGALAQHYAAHGLAGWFWAWILPHGIPEITAICIAGGAGLALARGLLSPGGLPRREALLGEAGTAVRLVLGTLTLFVLAGLVEGTVSQIHPPRLSVEFKLAFAGTLGVAVYAYLVSGWWRRGERSSDAER